MAETTLSFIGDISLNGLYREMAENGQDPFMDVLHFFKNSNFITGNLEAVIEGEDGENTAKQTRLKISKQSIELLKPLKLNLVTLANNHIYDQLLDGYKKTCHYLEENRIEYTGASLVNHKEKHFFIQKIAGRSFAFLNYVHASTNPYFPENCAIHVNMYERHTILREIKNLKEKVDYVILIFHWGFDNSRFPKPQQRKDAKAFAEAGADLIIGHHPHVLQGYERIKNTWVFYSLGNFAFAPLKEGKDDELDRNRQKDSIILHWILRPEGIEVKWNPVKLHGLSVIPADKSKIEKLSRLIHWVSNSFVWPFYRFYLTFVYKIYYFFWGNDRSPFKQLRKLNKSHLKKAQRMLWNS